MNHPAATPTVRDSARATTASPKRVLCIEANEDGTVGGSHRALFDLATKIDRVRFEPVVLFYQENPFHSQLRERGVEVSLFSDVRTRERTAYHGSGPLGKLRVLGQAVAHRIRYLREHRIDLIHINNSPKVGSEDWLPAAKILGIPCIANVMGDARGESTWFRRRLFNSFDHYLPISEYITDAMLGHGIPREQMDLIYLGVDLEAFRARVTKQRGEVRAALGLGEQHVLALMVGNVREWKGQHVVIEAMRRMPAERRQRLHVAFAGAITAGDQGYLESLQRTVAEHGLAENVSFLGGRSDVPDLLNAADLALHASILPEPFGLVVIEAMALGKPVVAARQGGPGEVIQGGAGITFEPTDPGQLAAILERLVGSAEERARLSAGALARVESFAIEHYVHGVEGAYEKVVG